MSGRLAGWFAHGLLLLLLPRTATAQDRFELSAPQLGQVSQAVLTGEALQVTNSQGIVTNYRRDSRYDSSDGRWLAYYSRRVNQILRWPVSNTGPMQLGQLRGGSVEYRNSRMTIRALGGVSGQRRVLPPASSGTTPAANQSVLGDLQGSDLFALVGGRQAADPQLLRIASVDQDGFPWFLSRGSGFDLSCVPAAEAALGTDWWVAPAGAGLVRLETYDGGRVYAVSARGGGQLALLPLAQDPRQLWRVTGGGRIHDRFLLENVNDAGQCLTNLGGGHVALQPIRFAATQLWMPIIAPPAVPFQPFWRSVSQEIHPNSQLPPAQLELVNTHRYALVVLLGDSRRGDGFEKIRIAPNDSKTIELERDAGATMVETYEIRSSAGVWQREQFVTAIPPASFYDLSVYEEHLQSIAIDRTGTSPNPIEDVNYVPKSVGWIPLPAGAELPATGRIEVYSQARSAGNPGAVRRLDPKQFDDAPKTDPVESLLKEFQSVPRRSF